MKKLWCVFLIFCGAENMPAQIPEEARDALEKYLENTESDADFTQLQEDLTAYWNKPVNINTASADALLQFPLLSPGQAIQIISHRNQFGSFLNIAELQVAGFSAEHIAALRPFISVEKPYDEQWKDFKHHLNHGDLLILNNAKLRFPADADTAFQGNLLAQNMRVHYAKSGLYSFGFSADKDAGESYWNRGPDYFSVHASAQNIGHIKQIVFGDYLLGFGQGLVMGSGFGMGKSAMVMHVKRTAPNLRAYRGINEFQFHRGVAATIALRNLEITAAIARNKLDARIATDSTSTDFGNIEGLDNDGLHRNAAELKNKQNSKRDMAGLWMQRKDKRGTIGAGINRYLYNTAILAPSQMYNQWEPAGTTLDFLHVFQAHTLRSFHVFSEWAYSPTNRSKAFSAGLLTSFNKYVDGSLVWRKYDAGFASPFSTAFGNNSNNEQGLYLGLKVNMTHKISLSSYVDFWTNPWLRYQIYAPSRGRDMLWQLDVVPKKKGQLYVRLRMQDKPQNTSESEPVHQVAQNRITSIRLHLSSPVDKARQIQFRGEYSMAQFLGKTYISSLVFAQFNHAANRGKTRITLRYSLYHVPYYYNRIYAFENQLLYDFGTAAFYGRGYSTFLLLQQKINKHWKAGMRLSASHSIAPGEVQSAWKQGVFFQVVYENR